jgi:hypothetical protein
MSSLAVTLTLIEALRKQIADLCMQAKIDPRQFIIDYTTVRKLDNVLAIDEQARTLEPMVKAAGWQVSLGAIAAVLEAWDVLDEHSKAASTMNPLEVLIWENRFSFHTSDFDRVVQFSPRLAKAAAQDQLI